MPGTLLTSDNSSLINASAAPSEPQIDPVRANAPSPMPQTPSLAVKTQDPGYKNLLLFGAIFLFWKYRRRF